MRPHTSSTSASDEPALSTMIMSFLLGPMPPRVGVAQNTKAAAGRPRPWGGIAAGVRSARGPLCVLGQSAWADLGEVEKVACPHRPPAHRGGTLSGRAPARQALFSALLLPALRRRFMMRSR